MANPRRSRVSDTAGDSDARVFPCPTAPLSSPPSAGFSARKRALLRIPPRPSFEVSLLLPARREMQRPLPNEQHGVSPGLCHVLSRSHRPPSRPFLGLGLGREGVGPGFWYSPRTSRRLERALDRAERLLTVLGSRLLESQKRVSESAEALSIRQAGESSIIVTVRRSRLTPREAGVAGWLGETKIISIAPTRATSHPQRES